MTDVDTTTPENPKTRRKQLVLAQKEERKKLSDDILKFGDFLIGFIPKNKTFTNPSDPAGMSYSIPDVREMMRNLAKRVREQPKTIKRAHTEGAPRNGGFAMPAVFDTSMHKFITEANFGNAYRLVSSNVDGKVKEEYVDTGKPLRSYLPVLMKESITTRGILTALFSIYERLSNNHNPGNKREMFSTPLMTKHFAKVYKAIAEKDRAAGEAEKDVFNPESFGVPRQQTIFSQCQKKKLDENEEARLTDPQLKTALVSEQEWASWTCRALNPKNKKGSN